MSDAQAPRNPVEELAASFLERYRRGEHPSLTEYAEKHPDLADEIRELFPALVLMERLAPDDGERRLAAAGRITADGKAPEQLGDYRILREVGRGGMGVVYEAEQESLGRHVALKLLPFYALLDPMHLKRFRLEARAAARLHHTNIVPVFGVGEQNGLHYYVMQFIQGQALDEVLRELRHMRAAAGAPETEGSASGRDGGDHVAAGLLSGRLAAEAVAAPEAGPAAHDDRAASEPAARATGGDGSDSRARDPHTFSSVSQSPSAYYRSVARIGVQAADALAYAHGQGVLHRDVKPSNMMLDARGNLWVTDFGLAKADDADELTHTGDVVGTLRYLAPERFQGWSDLRSDIYSLGLTLYELVTLRSAFDATDRARLVRQITQEDPPGMRRFARHLPRDLETIILKAIAREPTQRYATAGEMADDLRRFLADKPIEARRAQLAEHAWRWCRRNPAVAILAATLMLVLSIGSSLSALWLRHERNAAFDSLRRVEQAEAATRQAAGEARAAERLATERLWQALKAQARASRSSGRAGQRFETLRVLAEVARLRPALELDAEQVRELRNEAIAALMLPDLRVSAEWSGRAARGQVFALDPAYARYARSEPDAGISVRELDSDREQAHLTGGGGLRAESLLFSPSGKYLALRAERAGRPAAVVWELATGRRALEAPAAGAPFSGGLAFLPGDEQLALGGPKSVELYDLASAARVRELAIGAAPLSIVPSPDGSRLAVLLRARQEIQIWDLAGSRMERRLPQSGPTWAAAWHPHGRRLAAAAAGHIGIWDAETGSRETEFEASPARVTYLAFSPAGDLLGSTGYDGTTRLWDWQAGHRKVEIPHSLVLQFGSDGSTLGYDVQGTTLRTWEYASSACRRMVGAGTETGDVISGAFSPDGQLVACATNSGVALYDSGAGVLVRRLAQRDAYAALFEPDGTIVAASSEGIWRWPVRDARPAADLRFGPPVQLAAPQGNVQRRGDISRDGARLVFVAGPDAAAVLHRGTPDRLVPLGTHARVWSVAISPDGAWAATGPWNAPFVRIWDAETGRLAAQLEGTDSVDRATLLFTSDGQRLVTGDPREFRVWKVGSWALERRIPRQVPSGDLPGLATVARDCRLLAASWSTNVVKLYELATGAELGQIVLGDAQLIAPLCFSPDGSELALTDARQQLYLCELGRVRAVLRTLDLDWDSPLSARDPLPARVLPLRVESDEGGTKTAGGAASESARLQQELADKTRAIEQDAGDAAALADRGRIYQRLNDPDKAAADFERSSQLYTGQIERGSAGAAVYRGRAEAHYQLGRIEEAIADFSAALEQLPDDADLLRTRAAALAKLERWHEALADYTRLIELRPDVANTYLARGYAFSRLGDYASAIRDYQTMLEINPLSTGAMNGLAWLYLVGPAALRDPQRALELMQDAVRLEPNRWEYLSTLGTAYYRLDAWQKSVETLELAARARPEGGTAFEWFFMAMSYQNLGQPARARACYDKGVEWCARQKDLPASWAEDLAEFRSEAERLLDDADREPSL